MAEPTERAPDPAPAKPSQRAPAPDGKSPGWHVDPAPDGRGSPPEQKPPTVPLGRRLLSFFLLLLAVNLVLSFLTGQPGERTEVPYQPFFVQQLRAGNVAEITSRADTIQGELKRETRFDPPGDAEPVDVKQFKTEVPAFIDRAGLTRVLSEQDVVVNAHPPDDGRGFLGNLLLGFGPTLLLVAFFIWIARRQMQGGGMLGGLGKSTARRVEVTEQTRVTFDDVAGIDEAEDELVEIVDFLKTRTATGAWEPHTARGPALRAAGHGQDAAGSCGGG